MAAKSRVGRDKQRSDKPRSSARHGGTSAVRQPLKSKIDAKSGSRSVIEAASVVKRGPKASPKRKREAKPAARAARSASQQAAPALVEAALATFAHEVRTPLTGILAISDLLATSGLGERERRWVDTIKAGAEHLSALATVFVDAARPAGTRALLREEPFDLRALALAAGDSLAGRAVAKGLSCDVRVADDVPSLVLGDRIRLRAALENLVDNAVKFTEHGGVALDVTASRRVKGKAAGNKARVTFAVSDSGIGLTPQEIRRLFRPFSQANISIATRFGGAGLGLASVRQLARLMGGDVTAAPRAKVGTTFSLTVTLPAAPPCGDVRTGVSGEVTPQSARPLRILSVEDNPFGRVVLNTILSELGHHADFVGRGEDAIERVAHDRFDCVLMDMVLPGIGGVEAIRRIRKLSAPHGRVPVIGVSGRGEDEAPSRAAGADGFLLKPVSPRALATALLEVTRRAAAAT